MPKVNLTHPQHRTILRHLATIEGHHTKTAQKLTDGVKFFAHDDDLHDDEGIEACPQCQVILAAKAIRNELLKGSVDA